MRDKILAFLATFVAAAGVMCLMWWLTGFNFDKRNPDVAFGFVVTLFVCGMAGAITAMIVDFHQKFPD